MEAPLSDSEIVRQVKAGSLEDYAELVRRHQLKVLRLCHSIVGPSEAEDAAQEVFLKAYSALSDFRGDSQFSTWLYRIAYRHALNLLSKRKLRKTESLDALLEARGETWPDFIQNARAGKAEDDRQLAQAALARLTPDQRLVLTLREMEGLSYAEMAEVLGLTLDAVKVRLFRARKALTDTLKTLDPA
jgi:RNA polymerase sigma-70 factor (ECF subfamily)